TSAARTSGLANAASHRAATVASHVAYAASSDVMQPQRWNCAQSDARTPVQNVSGPGPSAGGTNGSAGSAVVHSSAPTSPPESADDVTQAARPSARAAQERIASKGSGTRGVPHRDPWTRIGGK